MADAGRATGRLGNGAQEPGWARRPPWGQTRNARLKRATLPINRAGRQRPRRSRQPGVRRLRVRPSAAGKRAAAPSLCGDCEAASLATYGNLSGRERNSGGTGILILSCWRVARSPAISACRWRATGERLRLAPVSSSSQLFAVTTRLAGRRRQNRARRWRAACGAISGALLGTTVPWRMMLQLFRTCACTGARARSIAPSAACHISARRAVWSGSRAFRQPAWA